MSFLLRKIAANKWQPNLGRASNEHSADAITGCTRTSNNTLSVWHSDTKNFEDESVKDLIVALAISMPQPAKIDVLWLDENWLAEKGLSVIQTPGHSCFSSVNSLHKDIELLDHEKLGVVSEHIVSQFSNPENIHSIARPKLIKLVNDWMGKGNTFCYADLSEKWREEIAKIQ